jgi:hypothetical protein
MSVQFAVFIAGYTSEKYFRGTRESLNAALGKKKKKN